MPESCGVLESAGGIVESVPGPESPEAMDESVVTLESWCPLSSVPGSPELPPHPVTKSIMESVRPKASEATGRRKDLIIRTI
jgi:hypothetical protein